MEAREREQAAVELLRAGATLQQISDRLGYGGVGNAHRALKRVKDRILKETAWTWTEYVEQQWERLEALHLTWWPKRGTPSGASVLLRIYERGASLRGLDAPKRTEITGEAGAPIQVRATTAHDELLARLARLAESGGAGEGGSKPDGGGG